MSLYWNLSQPVSELSWCVIFLQLELRLRSKISRGLQLSINNSLSDEVLVEETLPPSVLEHSSKCPGMSPVRVWGLSLCLKFVLKLKQIWRPYSIELWGWEGRGETSLQPRHRETAERRERERERASDCPLLSPLLSHWRAQSEPIEN